MVGDGVGGEGTRQVYNLTEGVVVGEAVGVQMFYGLVRISVREKVTKDTFIHGDFRGGASLTSRHRGKGAGKTASVPHSRRKMQIAHTNVGQPIVPGYCSVPQASLPSSFCACPW